VTQVVRWNEPLRERIGAIIGLNSWEAKDAAEVLSALRGPDAIEQLARRLQCDEGDVFITIRKRLVASSPASTAHPRMVGSATFADTLVDPKFIQDMALVFGCANDAAQVYDHLFLLQDVQDLLIEHHALVSDVHPDSIMLIRTLLRPEMLRRARAAYSATNIDGLLLMLLRDDAIEILCKSLDCRIEQIPRRLRRNNGNDRDAVIMKTIALSADNSNRLDLFAVEKFREFFGINSTVSLRQARESAARVLEAASAPRSARLVAALIDFWAMGSFRSALLKIPIAEWSVGDLASDIRTIDEVPFQQGVQLRISDNPSDDANLTIEYNPIGGSAWRPLILLQLGSIESRALFSAFPSLSDDLEGQGDQLGQRVVTSKLRSTSKRETDAWKQAIERESELTEFFVAAGIRIPDLCALAGFFERDNQPDLVPLEQSRLKLTSPEELLQSAKQRLGANGKPEIV
jgi:hypothetical protein